LNRQRLIIDYLPSYEGNFNPDPTIGAVLFKPVTPDFVDKGRHTKSLGAGHRKKTGLLLLDAEEAGAFSMLYPRPWSYRLDRPRWLMRT